MVDALDLSSDEFTKADMTRAELEEATGPGLRMALSSISLAKGSMGWISPASI